MNYLVNLHEHLLERGRRFQQLGRPAEALQALLRLTQLHEVPAEVSEEAHVRLAQLYLKRRRYARARRHLTIALHLQPNSARYHYLMASACRGEDARLLKRAASHYQRALELQPEDARILCDFGLLCLRQGQSEEGLAYLQRAASLLPDSAEVIGKLVSGLCQAGHCDEAKRVLHAALFRNPRSARFRKLWIDFQLLQIRRDQEVAAVRSKVVEEGPVLLPFVSPSQAQENEPDSTESFTEELPGRSYRTDDPSAALPAPHRPRLLRRPDHRWVR